MAGFTQSPENFRVLRPGPGQLTPCRQNIRQNIQTAFAPQHAAYSSSSLFTSAVTKEVPCGSDNLLEYHGLSGIYSIFMARGPDTFLKGLPSELDFRR